MGHMANDKSKLLGRVRRLRGQMEAIERAVDEEKECGEILHLVASVRGAMAGLTNELLDAHLRHHVLEVDDEAERRRGVEELSSALAQLPELEGLFACTITLITSTPGQPLCQRSRYA